jgi:hypothetical protein
VTLQELYKAVRVTGTQVTLNYDAPETTVIGLAVGELIDKTEKIRQLREVLAIYANEYFYDELPPSKASEDRGKLARAILESSGDNA